MKYALVVAAVVGLASPSFAEEAHVGVGVGPVGVTVGAGHVEDRDRERTTVIKEHEPRDKTVVIKKEHDEPEVRTKTIIEK